MGVTVVARSLEPSSRYFWTRAIGFPLVASYPWNFVNGKVSLLVASKGMQVCTKKGFIWFLYMV